MTAKDKTVGILKHMIPACFVFAIIVLAVTFDRDITGLAFGVALLIALAVAGVYYVVMRLRDGK